MYDSGNPCVRFQLKILGFRTKDRTILVVTHEPYPFISYFYYRVDTKKFGGAATDIFDSIAIPMLSRIGAVSLENDPDYVPKKIRWHWKELWSLCENWKTEGSSMEHS